MLEAWPVTWQAGGVDMLRSMYCRGLSAGTLDASRKLLVCRTPRMFGQTRGILEDRRGEREAAHRKDLEKEETVRGRS